ncbi:TrmH family RNA methyltransferase [candidate division KSB1 bacterium]
MSKNQIKLVNSLKILKYRRLHQQFIAEGSKLVLDLLESSFKTDLIFATKDWIDTYHTQILKHHAQLFPVSETEMARISGLSTPTSVLAIVNIPAPRLIEEIRFDDLILALDQISDPGNMGTIIRTADWFGVKDIICSADCVEVFNPKVIQSTMGSITRVRITSFDLSDLEHYIPSDFPVYGAFLEGESIIKEPLSRKGLIIMGNESKGISQKINPLIKHKIHIPSYSYGSENSDKAESLNVAVATAIILFEFRKKN